MREQVRRLGEHHTPLEFDARSSHTDGTVRWVRGLGRHALRRRRHPGAGGRHHPGHQPDEGGRAPARRRRHPQRAHAGDGHGGQRGGDARGGPRGHPSRAAGPRRLARAVAFLPVVGERRHPRAAALPRRRRPRPGPDRAGAAYGGARPALVRAGVRGGGAPARRPRSGSRSPSGRGPPRRRDHRLLALRAARHADLDGQAGRRPAARVAERERPRASSPPRGTRRWRPPA